MSRPSSILRSSRDPRIVLLLTVAFLAQGCRTPTRFDTPLVDEAPMQRQIETPNVNLPVAEEAVNTSEPFTVNETEEPEIWSLTLEEVVQIVLGNSEVIRNSGGRVVTGPAGTPTVYDVALQEIGPNGVEAALSAFDAQLASSLIFDRDENSFNNLFFGGGATSRVSNTANYNFELSKRTATGSQFFLRNVTGYNRDNTPSNLFSSFYTTRLEGEVRQPLLRGRGLDISRVAGPNGDSFNYNGVVLARIRTDIALADFEASVRDLMRDVENAYWNLYFAYRNLDARTAAYEAALASWRTSQDRYQFGVDEGSDEALARANYYQSKAQMQNALSGGTAGSGVTGVYSAERDLRLLMGIPANDGRLIRPADEPSVAERIFDWQDSLELAFNRRVELRRQRWTVTQREKELGAARHFLLSQIDFVGLYRYRGFGDDLFGNENVPNGSAVADLWTGDLQGWQLGLTYSSTLGKRREHAAVRSAELQLAREKAVLRNQELTISNNLSGQFAELERTYTLAQANFNRSIAERQRLDAAMAKYDAGTEPLEFLVIAQQTTANADSDYYRALVDYNLAVANTHYARGTYLDYMGVRLSEGPWSADALRSYRHEFRRFKPRMNYCKMEPGPVSAGSYSQYPPAFAPAEELPAPDMPVTPADPNDAMPAATPTEALPQGLPDEPSLDVPLDSVVPEPDFPSVNYSPRIIPLDSISYGSPSETSDSGNQFQPSVSP